MIDINKEAEEFYRLNPETIEDIAKGRSAYTIRMMVEFTKLRVEAALKAAHKNMQLPEEDLEFTLKVYPLDLIK
jgi:hypothetical protein